MVWLANDPVAIKELNTPGFDTHANNQKDLDLPSRLISKIFLFRTIFRGSGWAFANDSDFTHVSNDPEFWEERNRAFYKKYKGIDDTHQEWFQRVAEGRPLVSPFGREWYIPLVEKKGEWVVPINDASNYPVQGTGADIVCIARQSIRRRMKVGKMLSTVHDSIVLDVPEDKVLETSNMMYEVFDDIPKNVKKLFNIDLPIAFPCECKYGKNLKEMTKIEYNQH